MIPLYNAGMLNDILREVKKYNPDARVDLIRKAYEYAELLYSDKKRLSGEPYFQHSARVALLLAEIRVDDESIAAALLHDAFEEKDLTRTDLLQEFNQEIVDLVEGVARLKKISTKSGEKEHRENLRNLILSAAKDIRVVLIRLAEKIDNLTDIVVLDPLRQGLAIKKAFEIYAPLADRLGVHSFKRRLEDLAFKYQHPAIYQQIEDFYKITQEERQHYVQSIKTQLEEELNREGVDTQIFGRIKHHYSVYRKFLVDVKRKRPSDEIADYLVRLNDKIAFTVLVKTVEDCYLVLSILSRKWPQNESEYDDYISHPRANGYRSIHAALRILPDEWVEVQIKTEEMHDYNEYGPAAHSFYKEQDRRKAHQTQAPQERIDMFRELMRWQDEILQENRKEKAVRVVFLHNRVFVFTPKGDIKDLPRGATPIDFAYAVHSELGNSMVSAKINGKQVALDYQLENGDVCEVVTSKQRQHPSPDWLRIVKTRFANNYIRANLKDAGKL
jgi:guanosine-3',5'-bis(diphosphate) 3'-pyrophosphohydrolase